MKIFSVLSLKYKELFTLFIINVSVPWHACAGQRATLEHLISASTRSDLGTELRTWGLVTSVFTYCPIVGALKGLLKYQAP